jgi:hypothetical protein
MLIHIANKEHFLRLWSIEAKGSGFWSCGTGQRITSFLYTNQHVSFLLNSGHAYLSWMEFRPSLECSRRPRDPREISSPLQPSRINTWLDSIGESDECFFLTSYGQVSTFEGSKNDKDLNMKDESWGETDYIRYFFFSPTPLLSPPKRGTGSNTIYTDTENRVESLPREKNVFYLHTTDRQAGSAPARSKKM